MLAEQAAKEVMTPVVITIGEREKIEFASQVMAKHKIHALPVVDESGGCVGIITTQEVVEFEAIRKDVEKMSKTISNMATFLIWHATELKTHPRWPGFALAMSIIT